MYHFSCKPYCFLRSCYQDWRLQKAFCGIPQKYGALFVNYSLFAFHTQSTIGFNPFQLNSGKGQGEKWPHFVSLAQLCTYFTNCALYRKRMHFFTFAKIGILRCLTKMSCLQYLAFIICFSGSDNQTYCDSCTAL